MEIICKRVFKFKLSNKNQLKKEFFMSKLKTFALAMFVLVGTTTAANAATTILATDDFVGISFWVILGRRGLCVPPLPLRRGRINTHWPRCTSRDPVFKND